MKTIRIGLVGAGANTRLRHLPGFRAIEGVEVVAVANRTLRSAQAVAAEFAIPRVHSHWQAVVDDSGIDAVCIGTWPNLHAEVTCAALRAGKHVLCEARMAASVVEARQMLRTLQVTAKVGMLVPSPFGMKGDVVVREWVAERLGQVREIYVRALTSGMADPTTPLHWRQRAELSGVNVLVLGILNETVARWFGRTESVAAQTALFTPRRVDAETGFAQDVDVPDSVVVVARMSSGAQCLYHVSGQAHHGGPMRIEAFGTGGTIVYNLADDTIQAAGASEAALVPLPIPEDKAQGWRVEADFIDAIRDRRPVTMTSFVDGLKYMCFTEAVHRSAATARRVNLAEV